MASKAKRRRPQSKDEPHKWTSNPLTSHGSTGYRLSIMIYGQWTSRHFPERFPLSIKKLCDTRNKKLSATRDLWKRIIFVRKSESPNWAISKRESDQQRRLEKWKRMFRAFYCPLSIAWLVSLRGPSQEMLLFCCNSLILLMLTSHKQSTHSLSLLLSLSLCLPWRKRKFIINIRFQLTILRKISSSWMLERKSAIVERLLC